MNLETVEKQLSERLDKAFAQGRGLKLVPNEVCVLFLRLARLRDLERFGEKRDWPAITAYCPREGGAS